MKTWQINSLVLFVLLSPMVFVLSALGQTNGVPVLPGISPGGIPVSQTPAQYWDLIIACGAPFVVALAKKLVPDIPKVFLPVATPVIGVALGYVVNKMAGAHVGWFDAAKAGAMAVFVRETFDHVITQRMSYDLSRNPVLETRPSTYTPNAPGTTRPPSPPTLLPAA